MKKTTVVFDLDGTLLDTLQDLANAVNYALAQQGMPKRTLEEVRQFVGNGVRLLMIRAVPDGENNPLFEETFAFFKEYYGEHCNDNTKPYAGVVELIETLKEKGYAVAIVSNKIDFAVKELNDLYFKNTYQDSWITNERSKAMIIKCLMHQHVAIIVHAGF